MILAADRCRDRAPSFYAADSLSEVGNIRNPKLGDVALLIAEGAFGVWRLEERSDDTPDGFNFIQSNSCEYLWVYAGVEITVGLFGAVPDTGVDMTARVQAALDAAGIRGGNVIFPPGTFTFNGYLDIPTGVYLIGSGIDATILDFSNSTATGGFVISTGTASSLGQLASNVSLGSRSVVFATAPTSLAAGDIYLIYDSTDSSFSTAASYFRAGEFYRVYSRSGATVTNTTGSYAAYSTGAARTLYKVTPVTIGIRSMSMRFKQGVLYPGIKITYGAFCHFADLDLSGSQESQLELNRCYACFYNNITTFDVQDTTPQENYGVSILSCQACHGDSCHLEAGRHGLTHGTHSGTGGVPFRDCTVAHSFINATAGDQYGLDYHGGGEYCSAIDCDLPSGMDFGADHLQFTACRFWGSSAGGEAVFANGQLLGINTQFSDCEFIACKNIIAGNGLVNCGSYTHTARGGILRFKDCVFDLKAFTSTSGTGALTAALKFGPDVNSPTPDMIVLVSDCVFEASTSGTAVIYGVAIRPQQTKGIKRVDIKSCTFNKCGLWLENNVQYLSVTGCRIYDAADYGIQQRRLTMPVSYTSQNWTYDENRIYLARRTGMFLKGEQTVHKIDLTNNLSVNNAQGGPSGDSSSDSSCYVDGALELRMDGNDFGDDQAVKTQLRAYAIENVTTLFRAANHIFGYDNSLTVSNESAITIEYGEFTYKQLKEAYFDATPTTGNWKVGDRIWKPTPTAGASPGWICTTAGTGAGATWKEMAALAA